MSRRDDIPIADAGVWDIVDWPTVEVLSRDAPSDVDELRNRKDLALPWAAKNLIEAGTKDGDACRYRLCELAAAWTRSGQEARRRQQAAVLGAKLGADPERFIRLLTKYGLL